MGKSALGRGSFRPELFQAAAQPLVLRSCDSGHVGEGILNRSLFPHFAERSSVVGAGRFERPTPCAQGGYGGFEQLSYFQRLLLQADAISLLKAVELY